MQGSPTYLGVYIRVPNCFGEREPALDGWQSPRLDCQVWLRPGPARANIARKGTTCSAREEVTGILPSLEPRKFRFRGAHFEFQTTHVK